MKQAYSDLKKQLDEIIVKIQDPSTEIDDALELQKKAQEIITELEKYLQGVKTKLNKK